mmetsp:Transcript_35670/g.93706  ORF Transcript_35670/g.93706 Transcript_35670/m.93706 type:complete len:581 (+) Transcript_35670:110-1852(+)
MVTRLPLLLVCTLAAAGETGEAAPEATAVAEVTVAAAETVVATEPDEEEEDLYTPPATVEGAQFYEPFVDGWDSRWVVSKDAEFTGKWNHVTFEPDALKGDKGLEVGNAAQRHAVSTTFSSALDPKGSGLVVQYELQLKEGLTCGGAYLKLLSASKKLSLEGFKASTPYTIMFGPDKCGDTNKIHFIIRHKNRKTGQYEEKHLASPLTPNTNDKKSHLYTAIIGTDESVKILVDNELKKEVSLLSETDFKPPVNPTEKMDDPTDRKPARWVDEAKIDDASASKPDDWDETLPSQIEDAKARKPKGWLDDAPLKVPDPSVSVPLDWDEEEDGEWEPPLIDNPDCKPPGGCGEWKAPKISNPAYKGKWSAPKIDNPDYIGVWSPKQVANPDYFEDSEPHAMAPIGGIGIELWTMQNGILFDNILVSTDPTVAVALAEGTFLKRKAAEKEAAKKESRNVPKGEGFIGKLKEYTTRFGYWLLDHIIAVSVTFAILLISLVVYCCMQGGDEPPYYSEDDVGKRGPPKADDDGDDDGDDGDEAEGEPEPEEEDEGEEAAIEDVTEEKEEKKEEKKPSVRKRTPKAS